MASVNDWPITGRKFAGSSTIFFAKSPPEQKINHKIMPRTHKVRKMASDMKRVGTYKPPPKKALPEELPKFLADR